MALPPPIVTEETVKMAKKLAAAGMNNQEAATILKVGLSTYGRMKQAEWDYTKYQAITKASARPKPKLKQEPVPELPPTPEAEEVTVPEEAPVQPIIRTEISREENIKDLVIALQNIYGVLCKIKENTDRPKSRGLFR